jgi:hypothetical protein
VSNDFWKSRLPVPRYCRRVRRVLEIETTDSFILSSCPMIREIETADAAILQSFPTISEDQDVRFEITDFSIPLSFPTISCGQTYRFIYVVVVGSCVFRRSRLPIPPYWFRVRRFPGEIAPGVSQPQSLILLSLPTISGGRDGRFLDIVVVCYDVLRSNGRSLYTAFVSDDFRRRSKEQIPPYRFRFQRFPEEVETARSFIPFVVSDDFRKW